MNRARFVLLLAAAAALGGVTASAALPAFAGGNDVKKIEALRKKRDDYRKKQKDAGKLPFFDLSYAADPKAVQETRWSQTDPPTSDAKEYEGLQFNAAWSPDITKGGAIRMFVQKFPHKTEDGKGKYTMNWEHAGKTCDCSDSDAMLLGKYLNEKRQMKDPIEKKCVEPKKRKVGPCDGYASVWGTDSQSQKRTRQDFYKWVDSGATWLITVVFEEKYLDDPGVMEKAEELIKTMRELKAPD